MKVAVVSIGSFDTQYSDYHLIRDIIVGLLDRGHSVSLIQKQYAPRPRYPMEFEPYLESEQLTVHNFIFERREKTNLKSRYLADLTYYMKTCRVLKYCDADAIYLQSNNTAFLTVFYAKHILKKPLLYNEQDIFPDNAIFAEILGEKSLVYKIAHIMQKYAYKNATVLSTISDDMRNTISSYYSIPKEKIQVIYNWGHESKQKPKEENVFLKAYPKRENEFRTIYAGNLGKMQNVELILQTALLMKESPDFTFYIVGNGANEAKLKEYAESNALSNVTFVDMQAPETVGDLYSAADVNLIPLQPKLIFAALPSKTADCLLADRPIVACVDQESIFARMLAQYGIADTAPDDADELEAALLAIYTNGWEGKSQELLCNHFDKTQNVAAFCGMIENIK